MKKDKWVIKLFILTLFFTFVLCKNNLVYGVGEDNVIHFLNINLKSAMSITKEEKEKLVDEIEIIKKENKDVLVLLNAKLQGNNQCINDEYIIRILEMVDIKYYDIKDESLDLEEIINSNSEKLLCSNMEFKSKNDEVCEYLIKDCENKKIAILGVEILERYISNINEEIRIVEPKEKILSIIDELKKEKNIDEILVIPYVEKNGLESEIIRNQLNEISKINEVKLIPNVNSKDLMNLNKININAQDTDDAIYNDNKYTNEDYEMENNIEKNDMWTLETELIHDNIIGLSPLGEFLSFNLKEIANSEIAIIDGENIMGKLGKGSIFKDDIAKLFKVDTSYEKVMIKGNELKKLIENGIKEEGCIQFYGVKVEYFKYDKDNFKIKCIKTLDDNDMEKDKSYNCIIDKSLLKKLEREDYEKSDEFYLNNEKFINLIVEKIKECKNIKYSFTNALTEFKEESNLQLDNEYVDNKNEFEAELSIKADKNKEKISKNEMKNSKSNGNEKLPQTGVSLGTSNIIKYGEFLCIIACGMEIYKKIKTLKKIY